MHMSSGRAVVVAAIATVVRPGQSFLMSPALGGHVERNVRCMMFSTRIPSCANAATAAFEIDTAERRAERLWQLSDAEKPALGERPDTGLVQEVAARLRYSRNSDHTDDFVEEAELSALRRYHYGGLEEGDEGEDDREYYI